MHHVYRCVSKGMVVGSGGLSWCTVWFVGALSCGVSFGLVLVDATC